MNILLMTNELRYTCGVTNHLLHLVKGLSADRGTKLFIIAGGGNGIERFDKLPVEITEDQRFLHSNRNSINYISAVAMLSGYLKQNQIDIIHSHTHYAANIAAHATLFKNIPRVQTNHGILSQKGRLDHFRADKYIAINEHIYDYIIENNVTEPDNVKFIRCGIEIPVEVPDKQNLEFSVLAASRFTPEKGIDIYIKAANKLKGRFPDVRFRLAGEGEEEINLMELNEGLGSAVEFMGRVTDMYAELARTQVLVYPSRSVNEGFPAVITEAGALGTIVISSEFSGAKCVIAAGEDALVFRTDDVDKLTELLLDVLTNYPAYSGMAVTFRKKVQSLFDLGLMIKKHRELYKECLSR